MINQEREMEAMVATANAVHSPVSTVHPKTLSQLSSSGANGHFMVYD